jgi:CRP-like cAMP-binding protein
MSLEDFGLLGPHLKESPFDIRHTLERPNAPIEYVYFPDTGFASVVACDGSDKRTEVGIIGCEGMSGTAIILGAERSPHECYVQVAGTARRVHAEKLRELMAASPGLQEFLMRYVQAFLIQTAHTALANGRSKLEERLARWILMSHDRVDGDEIVLTHEFLALMLAVQRSGVTLALHFLEGRGFIQAKRGRIIVIDRDGLIATSDGSYGIPEAEYRRLIGVH